MNTSSSLALSDRQTSPAPPQPASSSRPQHPTTNQQQQQQQETSTSYTPTKTMQHSSNYSPDPSSNMSSGGGQGQTLALPSSSQQQDSSTISPALQAMSGKWHQLSSSLRGEVSRTFLRFLSFGTAQDLRKICRGRSGSKVPGSTPAIRSGAPQQLQLQPYFSAPGHSLLAAAPNPPLLPAHAHASAPAPPSCTCPCPLQATPSRPQSF